MQQKSRGDKTSIPIDGNGMGYITILVKMIEEKILTPILDFYMTAPYEDVVKNIIDKQHVDYVKNMQIIIYSNDHNPPHFHVISKDKSIDAKFTIEDCAYLGGDISNKDLKRIQAFHADMKTQTLMKMIWNKRK